MPGNEIIIEFKGESALAIISDVLARLLLGAGSEDNWERVTPAPMRQLGSSEV